MHPPSPLPLKDRDSFPSLLHTQRHEALAPYRSKPFGLWVWVVCLGLTLGWDASGADLRVMAWLGDAQGFALRDHWWLSTVLHEGAKRLAVLVYLALLWMTVSPWGPWRQIPRLQRLEIVMGITLSLLMVSALKRISLTSCPWELQSFGGAATYISHWSWGTSDGGSGHCFPGGHASSAMAFLAMSLPWLASEQAQEQRKGWVWLAAIVLMGIFLGAVQTLRGAHYPSHTAWTALICAATAWANHQVFRRLQQSNPRLSA
jgi:membrane-associated PAP2 superfamily phosphatase